MGLIIPQVISLVVIHALLFGLPKNQIEKLRKVLNAAARIVTKSPKSVSITAILKDLHWLPIPARIELAVNEIAHANVNNLSAHAH